MNNTKRSAPDARELLREAEHAARDREEARALDLFERCIAEYLRRKQTFRAIAAARRCRRALGRQPKAVALTIRTYCAAGLFGDAQNEIRSASRELRRDSLGFLAALDDEAFVDVLSLAEPVEYARGRVVLRQDEPGGDVFAILDGACEVTTKGGTLAVLGPGDIFGEIGFFGHKLRSATVKTIAPSRLLRLPAQPLRGAAGRHACLAEVLERVYGERLLMKVTEDLEGSCRHGIPPEPFATLRFSKGQEIPVNPAGSVAILKHGVVEVDYDNNRLKTKRYYKPGSVISRDRVKATAGTDVVIVLASTAASHGGHGRA
ncbi:MAG TPA: cyclic nucleotide-binding domain-containing protein [Deltaproteobacteria bacterium]|nr:cyclic nucleotide-binding domain-containing protein [Deltaproteobacteria bacterium]